MAEYIEKAPSMKEKAGFVTMMQQKLGQMKGLESGSLQALHDATKALPDLQRQLRQRPFEKFQALVKGKLVEVSTMMPQWQGKLQKAEVSQVVALLQEAITVFPLESGLNSTLEAAGLLPQEHDKQELVQSLLEACKPCLGEDMDEDLFVKSCQELENKLGSIQVPSKMLEEQCKPTLVQVVDAIYHFLQEHWGGHADVPEFAFSATHCLDRIWEMLPDDPVGRQKVEHWKDSMFLVQGHDSLAKVTCQENVGDAAVEEACLVLQRRLEKFALSCKSTVKDAQSGCPLEVAKSQAVFVKNLHATKNQLFTKVHGHMMGCYKELANIAGGMLGGKDWAVAWEGETFAELVAHANQPMAPETAARHSDCHDNLDQVLSMCHDRAESGKKGAHLKVSSIFRSCQAKWDLLLGWSMVQKEK